MENIPANARLYLVSLFLLLLLGPTILAAETRATQFAQVPAQIETGSDSLQCPDPPKLDGYGNTCLMRYELTWDSVPDATAYVVEEDDNEGFSSPREAYRGAHTEAWVPVVEGSYYCFRVRAETASCTTDWSNAVCGSLTKRLVLHAINNPNGDGDYELWWSWAAYAAASTGLPSGFSIQEDTSPSFGNPSAYGTLGPPYVFSGKDPGTYYYRVRSTSTHCVPSEWSNVQTVTVDAPPTDTPTPTATATHTPPPQYWFNGYVYNDDTGEGIRDVTVKLHRWTGTEWTEINSKTTNEAGLF